MTDEAPMRLHRLDEEIIASTLSHDEPASHSHDLSPQSAVAQILKVIERSCIVGIKVPNRLATGERHLKEGTDEVCHH